MDNWDLWSSPYVYWDTSDDSVEPGSVYLSDLDAWLRGDCRYKSGGDLMEKSAMNEKSCIQVLKILIPKADTEIDELEKELVCLQSELAWAEHEHWSRICLKALRESSCFLSVSIKNLKSKDPITVAFQLQMFKEPAEHIHEILKPVLRKYFPERDEQNKQASKGIALKSSSGSSVHASTGLSDERGDPDNSKSITCKMEEPVDIGGGDHGERCVTLKLLEKNTNVPQNNSGRPE